MYADVCISIYSLEDGRLCTNVQLNVSSVIIIGTSLSEPHINSTAMRAICGICMYVCMVRPSHSVYMHILVLY